MRFTIPPLLRVGLPVLILFSLSMRSTARAQPLCEEELQNAEAKYFNAEYDAAIALINDCLSHTGLPGLTLKRAYKWMALVYIAKGDTARARVNVGRLLTLDPDYEPAPGEDLPKEFVEMMTKERQHLEAEKRQREEEEARRNPPPPQAPRSKSNKKWVWISLGGAALGGGAYAILSIISDGNGNGNGNGQKLADPPNPPGN